MLGAREYALAEDPILRSTVDALSAKLGIRAAEALSDPRRLPARPRRRPRAERARRSRSRPACSVRLSPAQLEGVLAHELAHVRTPRRPRPDLRRDARGPRSSTSRASAAGSSVRSSPSSARSRPRSCTCCSRRSGSSPPTGSRRGLCGSADGLADALLRLDRASDLVSFQASPATEPLYTVNPFAEEGLAALFVTHPPLERRLEALRGDRRVGATTSSRRGARRAAPSTSAARPPA